jgi:tetratricopeptide (TPR) repeat protein
MARTAYDKAVRVNPEDARLRYERDQLWKRTGVAPEKRLRALEQRLDLVAKRDDLTLELCALYNQTGRHDDALRLLEGRRFQPWEGGEGVALGEHMRTHVALGRRALEADDAKTAAAHFAAALETPDRLGESRHLLANCSDLHYWLGVALERCGDRAEAKRHWTLAAEFRGDFQGMSVRTFSEMTYFSARSMERVGRRKEAANLLRELLAYAKDLAKTEAKIDYFATSLPTMLLFDDDLQARQKTTALFLEAQARFGLGERAEARKLIATVLRRDPNHALAADLAEELHSMRARS